MTPLYRVLVDNFVDRLSPRIPSGRKPRVSEVESRSLPIESCSDVTYTCDSSLMSAHVASGSRSINLVRSNLRRTIWYAAELRNEGSRGHEILVLKFFWPCPSRLFWASTTVSPYFDERIRDRIRDKIGWSTSSASAAWIILPKGIFSGSLVWVWK